MSYYIPKTIQDITNGLLSISEMKLLDVTGGSAPALSASDHGRIYFDSTSNTFKVSEDGGAYVDMLGGGSPGGATTNIQFNDSGAFGGSADFTWDDSTKIANANGAFQINGGTMALQAVGARSGLYHASGANFNYRSNTGSWSLVGPTPDSFSFFQTSSTKGNVNILGGGPQSTLSVSGSFYLPRPSSPGRNTAAIMQVESILAGFLPPVMTTAERDEIRHATGTATVVDYTLLSGAVLTLNGVALTEGVEWTAATDNETTATSLASAITTATATTFCTASTEGDNVVNIIANDPGAAGNSITITTSDSVNLPVNEDLVLINGGDPTEGLQIYNTTTNQPEFYNGTVWAGMGGGGSPAGANTQIQFNDSGAFGASPNFTFDDSAATLDLIDGATLGQCLINLDTDGLAALQGRSENGATVYGQVVFASNGGSGGVCQVNAASPGYAEVTAGNGSVFVYHDKHVNIQDAVGHGDASAYFQITTTTKGFLPPRMTTTQRDAIATPAEGLVIYNTTTHVLNFYNGTTWGAV